MTNININDLIREGKSKVDKASATLLVSNDSDRKRFIAESLLAGAVVYLLTKYCDGFLRGLGYDALAEKHGKKAAELLSELRTGEIIQLHLDDAQRDLGESISIIRDKPGIDAALKQGTDYVMQPLLEAGAVRAQAREVANTIAELALGAQSRG
jgi:hypothetical protein